MLLLAFATLLIQISGSSGQALDVNAISLDEKVLAIERMMLTPGTIDFQVAPCKFLLNGPPPEMAGEQTSAHWVRTVFHDFVTADVAAGTGGLDASVGFESHRAENDGTVKFDGLNFIDRTIIGFNLFSSVFVSTSDFIALGLAEAILSCDPNSPMMELRVGRIDATAAGPPGVPGPADSFASQKAAFARAGMNATEMIQAVACGHSLGGVHNVTFPQIVGNQPVNDDFGTDFSSETDFFDDTPYVFDNVGLQNYLNGTNKAGGPLVTTDDVPFRSDLRIFKSDNDTTVKAMAKTQSAFEQTCLTIFAKMINTVPRGVTLSAPIGPRQWITMFGFVDLTATGAPTYTGQIGTYSKTGSPSTASYIYGTVGGGNTGPKTSKVGIPQVNLANPSNGAPRFPFFGITTYYNFNDTLDPQTTQLTIQGTYTEPINLKLFIVPSLSFRNLNAGPKYLVRAALLTSLTAAGTTATTGTTLTATLFYAAGQANSTSPVYKRHTATLTFWKKLGSYSLFSGTITQPSDLPTNGGGGSAIDVKLGSTLRSVKAQVINLISDPTSPDGRLFASCSNSDLTTCPFGGN